MWPAQPARMRRWRSSATDGAVLHLTTGAFGDGVLQIDPVTLGNAEQVGGAPDDVVLELTDLAVGIDQLPHHLDDALAALFIERAHDDAGETIEIDGLALDLSGIGDEPVRGAAIEPEMAFD